MPRSLVHAVLLLALILHPLAAAGQQPDSPTRAAAQKLHVLMKTGQNVEPMIQAIMKAQEATIASQNLSEEQKKQLLARTRSFMDTAMKPIMEKTEALSIEAYAATFTLEELEGLIAFYQSPVGQKFIEKQPQLMTTLMQQTTALTQSLMPDLLRKMQEETKREIERTRKGQ